MEKVKDTIIPFSCGSEYTCWHSNNCCKCKKYSENIDNTCRLEYALAYACVTDGKMKKSIYDKIGLPNNCKLKALNPQPK